MHVQFTRSWFVAFVALAAVACGSSSRTDGQTGAGGSGAVASGAGGDAGSGATGGNNEAGSNNSGSGGTGATGGTVAATGGVGGSSAGAGGANAGSAGDAGMGNDGGRAGTQATGGQGGAGALGQGGDSGGGSGGIAGMAGAGGAAGAGGSPPSGLDDGDVDVDLTVTVMDASARVTRCPGEFPYDPGTMADMAGVRTGVIKCERTTTEGTLVFRSLYLGLNPERIGVHDARDLTITCTSNPPLCVSIATLTVAYESLDGGNTVSISASQADARSGTLRLDQFTADGEVSGSLDVTLTEGDDTVHIEGRFRGNLRNCGTVMSLSYDPCTGDPA